MTAFSNTVDERMRAVLNKTSGRRLTFRMLLLALYYSAFAAGGLVQAMPEDGNVADGTADIVQSTPKRLDIIQSSDSAIIDWRSFSIDVDEHTNFQQPSASSITLNRVQGGAYSNILGRLTANGQVMLINPNGILFGKTAVVDVAGLVATTIDIRNENFMAGRFNFEMNLNPGGTVVNRGRITAAEGGLAALVAPGVENSGVIRARLGRVALSSGNAFTVDLHGDSLIRLRIDDRVAERLTAPDGAPLTALVSNSGTISADGGTVVLAAGAAKDVVDHVINMDGIVEARSAEMRNGQIHLLGNGEGIVRVTGKLDVSGKGRGETGGSATVLGEKVGVVGRAEIEASGHAGGGTVLIGGNFQGKGPERNAEYAMVGGDATIRADATVNGDGGKVIVWSERITRFLRTISARGGAHAGDGGFAEVSGKRHLRFAPTAIDLSAPSGSAGELLLDPQDIVISDGDGSSDSEFDTTNNAIYFGAKSRQNFNIRPSVFEAIDANVTLQADRDLTVSSPIERSGSANSTLVLQAGRHLTINAAITGTNGTHSYIFEADSPRAVTGSADGVGTLTIGDVAITSNGGAITLLGAGFAIDTTTDGNINAGAGNINVVVSRGAMTISSGTADHLSAAEIRSFRTTGTLTLGRGTSGQTSTGAADSLVEATGLTVREAITVSDEIAALVLDSGGTTTLGANITTSDGHLTFADAVTLESNVSLNSDSDNDGTAGNIAFSRTVNSADATRRALTIAVGTGTVTFDGAVGGTRGVGAITLTGNLDLNAAITSASSLSVSGTSNLGANVTTTGTQTYTGAVTLSTAVTLTTTNAAVTFSRTVNGG